MTLIASYGGPDKDRRTESIRSVHVSDDARRVTLRLDSLRAGYVYELRIKNLSPAGQPVGQRTDGKDTFVQHTDLAPLKVVGRIRNRLPVFRPFARHVLRSPNGDHTAVAASAADSSKGRSGMIKPARPAAAASSHERSMPRRYKIA